MFPNLRPLTALFWPLRGPTVTVGKGSSPLFMGNEERVVDHWTKGSKHFARTSMNDPFPWRAQKGWTQIDPNRENNT